PRIAELVSELARAPMKEALAVREKHSRSKATSEVADMVLSRLCGEGGEYVDQAKEVGEAIGKVKKQVARMQTLESCRIDGRKNDEIRNISCEVGVLPRAHGSALFTRGETQALVTCTL